MAPPALPVEVSQALHGIPPATVRSAEDIVTRLAYSGRALVALSGGVDSAVVGALARRALGENCMAVTVVGAAVSTDERESAAKAARSIGIAHTFLEAEPLGDPSYRANPPDRCYFCRKVETQSLRNLGADQRCVQFLDGVHRDDLEDDRPGLRAMDEAGFRHPLFEAGWGKSEVRAFARQVGLPNWDRPSNACLASRVAPGEPISADLLQRVERAESDLLGRGFRRVRVRVSRNVARVLVAREEVPHLVAEPEASSVRGALRRLGFDDVLLDLNGYPLRAPA